MVLPLQPLPLLLGRKTRHPGNGSRFFQEIQKKFFIEKNGNFFGTPRVLGKQSFIYCGIDSEIHIMLAVSEILEIKPMGVEIPNRDYFISNIEAHLDQLFSSALRMTKHRADAEDLVAETVTRALSHIDSLQDTARFVPWLLRIMTNTFISEKRKAASRIIHESYMEESEEEDSGFSIFERLHQPFLLWWSNPEQEFLNQLLQEDLERALDTLPDNFRLVVMLSDIEGLSYQEIAEALDVPVGTVRSRLARGRGLLQKTLWNHALDRDLVPDNMRDN